MSLKGGIGEDLAGPRPPGLPLVLQLLQMGRTQHPELLKQIMDDRDNHLLPLSVNDSEHNGKPCWGRAMYYLGS